MKIFVAVLVAALLATASAAPPPATCDRGLATSGGDKAARFAACQVECGDSLTQDDPTTTSDPISLLTASGGNPDHTAATSGPFTTAAALTQFRNDHVLIYFTESIRYYGQAFGATGDQVSEENPDARFGTNPQIASNTAYSALFDKVVYQYTNSTCTNVFEMDLVWGNFLSTYAASDSTNAGNALGAWTRTQDSGTKVITYTVYFSVVNYEYIVVSRPSGPIPLERTIQHSVPFQVSFVTQASITSSSIQVYSQIYALAAIVSQSVTVDLTANQAQAVINLYTSIQNPFVIDELRVTSGPAGKSVPTGDTPADVVAASNSTYSSTPFNVYVDGGASATIRTATVDDQGVASQNGGTGNSFLAARANEAGSCDGSSSTVCSQIWPIRLGADIGNNVCNFDGSYVVTFTIRCRSGFSPCPINRNSAYNNERIAVGTVGDVTGINQEQFTLTIASSNHCPTVIDTIGLSAQLTTHGEPLSGVTASIAAIPGTVLDSPYVTVPSTALSAAGIPNGNYTSTTGASPVPAPNDPDAVEWGPDAPDASYSLSSQQNGKVAFLNGQWVFGVAAVQVQQATVVRSSITSLSIAGINSNDASDTTNIVTSSTWDSAWTPTLQSALKFAFVDDVTAVNINNPNKIAYPYFFFEVDQGALNIAGDANKPITFSGTVTVTYQNAASGAFGAEELSSVDMPFEFSLLAASPASLKNTGSSISATIGVGNSASTGTASAGNSTFLGVSSSTAAGVALAVGVVVGLLVGLLVAAARRPAAPTKSASQVQLTSAAATSAV